MSCTDIVCGTGNWTGPKPGDPANIAGIQARGIVGAIEVTWSYPVTNPHAVAFIKLYRGINSIFANAIELATVSGNYFIDYIPESDLKMYYYWIQLVSVNGTVYDVVGPASATPLSKTQDTLDSLSGQIDEGYLAQALQSRLGMIDALRTDLAQEILDRVTANSTLSSVLSQLQAGGDEARTLILNEVIQRQDADEALISTANALAASLNDNIAALVSEQQVRATADSAAAQDINILYTQTADNQAAILTEQATRTTQNSALTTQLNSLVSAIDDASAAIANESIARANADSAITTNVNTLIARTDEIGAAVETVENAHIGYAVLAGTAVPFDGNGITTVYPEVTYPTVDYPEYAIDRKRIIDKQGVINWNATTAGQVKPLDWLVGLPLATSVKQVGIVGPTGEYASLEQGMQAQLGLNNEFKAMYTAKVDVNGLVGGFGIYNDGDVVEAGFDVDKFWVGRTSNKVKPFIVQNDIVYIDKARIRNADIDTLKLAGAAVTVPLTARSGKYVGMGYDDSSIYNHTAQIINRGKIFLSDKGIVYAHCVASQWYGQGMFPSLLSIEIVDATGIVESSFQGGYAVVPSPTVAASALCAQGWVEILVRYTADPKVHISDSTLFVMGAKR